MRSSQESHSHVLTFTVPASLLPRIVGRKGQTVHLIKEETDTRIDFDRPTPTDDGESSSATGDVTVTVEGPEKGCKDAKKKIMDIVNEQLDVAEQHLSIPRRIHRMIIGHSGVGIRNLVSQWAEDLGVNSERINIKFAKDEGDEVVVRTPKKALEKVIGWLEAEVTKHEASLPAHSTAAVPEGAERIEDELMIPKADVARVVGRKGETITAIADNHGVDIQINQDASGQEGLTAAVKISGYSQEAIDGAKVEILVSFELTVRRKSDRTKPS